MAERDHPEARYHPRFSDPPDEVHKGFGWQVERFGDDYYFTDFKDKDLPGAEVGKKRRFRITKQEFDLARDGDFGRTHFLHRFHDQRLVSASPHWVVKLGITVIGLGLVFVALWLVADMAGWV